MIMADQPTNPNGTPPNGAAPADLAAHQARLQAAFMQALTEDDIRTIARKLIEQARDGDQTSARLVLKYSLGAALGAGEPKAAAKPNFRPDPESAAFVANAAKLLREIDAQEAEERRQAAAAHRPGGPPSGHARR
jgi:hypothetical protein